MNIYKLSAISIASIAAPLAILMIADNKISWSMAISFTLLCLFCTFFYGCVASNVIEKDNNNIWLICLLGYLVIVSGHIIITQQISTLHCEFGELLKPHTPLILGNYEYTLLDDNRVTVSTIDSDFFEVLDYTDTVYALNWYSPTSAIEVQSYKPLPYLNYTQLKLCIRVP